jgi:hypothetical protein
MLIPLALLPLLAAAAPAPAAPVHMPLRRADPATHAKRGLGQL